MALIDEISIPVPIENQNPLGFVNRYGFIFQCGRSFPPNILDTLLIRPLMVQGKTPGSMCDLAGKTEKNYVDFINDNQLTKVCFATKTFDIARYCPCLQIVNVFPNMNFDENLDLSPLYTLEHLKSLSMYICLTRELERQKYRPLINKPLIDYSKFCKLENLETVLHRYGHVGYNKIQTLKTLSLTRYEGLDLWQAFCSPLLDSLSLSDTKIKTLDGIEQSSRMQCLHLLYCRSLHDISALQKVKSTLKALSLDYCPKIKDLSVLSELENLEYLRIEGTFTIPDVEFLKGMKNLKTLILTCRVESGDMSPCLGIQTVYFDNKRHYNLKNEDMQHTEPRVLGNEDIEAWRRIGM